jgi:hypothetical protein
MRRSSRRSIATRRRHKCAAQSSPGCRYDARRCAYGDHILLSSHALPVCACTALPAVDECDHCGFRLLFWDETDETTHARRAWRRKGEKAQQQPQGSSYFIALNTRSGVLRSLMCCVGHVPRRLPFCRARGVLTHRVREAPSHRCCRSSLTNGMNHTRPRTGEMVRQMRGVSMADVGGAVAGWMPPASVPL